MSMGAFCSNSMECRACCSGSSRVSVGRFWWVPLASDIRFSNAAAGLKNMCANFDQGTPAKSTVVARM